MQSSGNAADFLIYFILGSPFGWLQSFAIYVRNAQWHGAMEYCCNATEAKL